MVYDIRGGVDLKLPEFNFVAEPVVTMDNLGHFCDRMRECNFARDSTTFLPI